MKDKRARMKLIWECCEKYNIAPEDLVNVYEQHLKRIVDNLPLLFDSKGVELVAAERKRQIEVEGWDNLHDADHDKMQLTGAAACYAANAINKKCGGPISRFQYNFPPEMNFLVNNGDRGDRKLDKGGWRDGWPWESSWDKRDKHDVLRSLVISAALIVAEIDNILTPPATT